MKNTFLMVVFVVLTAAIIGLGSWYAGQLSGLTTTATDTTASNTTSPNGQSSTAAQSTTQTQPMTLQIKDDVVGTGAVAAVGDQVTVNYVGTLDNGTKFDSSYDRNQPFSFVLGVGQVIRGWDQGVVGMKVGGKRELVIPADLGYGATGAGSVIPPNATLHFTVELLAVSTSTGQ
jgi:FKBP-type peptidyl-prolyl cis-trans isomerase